MDNFSTSGIIVDNGITGNTLNFNFISLSGTNISDIFYSITNPSPDNFVTGGTYSNGTLTLNRQNGSVSINGFPNGGTSGDSSYSIVKLFNNYVSSATTGEQIILCNTSGGTFNVTLPNSGNVKVTVKKVGGVPNLVINTSGGQTIDGASTATIRVVNASITFITDELNWFII